MKIYFTKFFFDDEDYCDYILELLNAYFNRTIEEYGFVCLYDLEGYLADLAMIKPEYSDMPFEHIKLGYDKNVKFVKIFTRKHKAYNMKGFRIEFQFAFINFKKID